MVYSELVVETLIASSRSEAELWTDAKDLDLNQGFNSETIKNPLVSAEKYDHSIFEVASRGFDLELPLS